MPKSTVKKQGEVQVQKEKRGQTGTDKHIILITLFMHNFMWPMVDLASSISEVTMERSGTQELKKKD